MILKGSQRAGAGQLAAHLINDRDNEHVRLHELRGFVASDLHGALAEAHAVSKGTKCTQFMFSLSLNPPKGAEVGEEDFERAADQAEKALGLDGQPRAVVLHEKEGRMHAHVVWSRIDAATMRAVHLPHFKRKLTALSRALYLEHDWALPDGLRSDGGKNPLNFTLAEWQQCKRLGVDPREIKAVFREAWDSADSMKALGGALAERGYFLAQGDRRGLVAVGLDGKEFAFARYAGIKTKVARARLGDGSDLPGVAAVKAEVSRLVSGQLKGFIRDARERHTRETATLRADVDTLRAAHGGERAVLGKKQAERWARETQERADRLRAGLAGLWDTLTGRAKAIRILNEREAIEGMRRDRAQRDRLIHAHLKERAPLQTRLDAMKARHARERQLLARDIVARLRARERPERRHDLSLER